VCIREREGEGEGERVREATILIPAFYNISQVSSQVLTYNLRVIEMCSDMAKCSVHNLQIHAQSDKATYCTDSLYNIIMHLLSARCRFPQEVRMVARLALLTGLLP